MVLCKGLLASEPGSREGKENGEGRGKEGDNL
jgi:hypothetical protein